MHCKDTILRTQNNWPYSKLIPNSGIELNDLKFLKDANGDDGVDSFEPKASGSFVWEGELKDITSWMNGDEYGRSLSYGSPWNKLSRIAR